MSTVELAAAKIMEMESKDWRVLSSFEKALDSYLSVPTSYISDDAGVHQEEVEFRLAKLKQFEFIAREGQGHVLLTQGLDALALNRFVKKSRISVLRGKLGVGKESDVFEVTDDDGDTHAIKFYRIGRTSFRGARLKRRYLPPQSQHSWFRICIEAAKSEVKALTILRPLCRTIPEALSREAHAILMRKVEGKLLSGISNIPDPTDTLRRILEDLRVVYTKSGLINGDLSEFNILFDGEKPWIIDWPQSVTIKHQNALELLTRDISNVLNFFSRKHGLECDLKSTVNYVQGQSRSVEIN